MKTHIAIAFALFCASAAPCLADTATLTWTIEGVRREAIVVAPNTSRNSPLVFVFHPHGGTAEASLRLMHFQSEWPSAIVVYPQGLPTATPVDPQGGLPGWQREPGQYGDRDLKFFDAMLATVRSKYHVDNSRVFAAGFSNGAIFCFLLWAQRPDVFAGFGICAGVLLPSVHLSEPRPVMHIAGKTDTVAKFALQEESIDAERRMDAPAHVRIEAVIHPGGHVYPPWATRRIVRFFSALR